MIRITSDYLKKSDLALLKRYVRFVMLKMVTPSVLRKATISIRIVKREDIIDDPNGMDLKDYGAWVEQTSLPDGKKKFDMILNARRLNMKAKKPIIRMKKVMHDLAHELVHIKQYLTNELFDYKDGKARFKGEIFTSGQSPDIDEVYFNSPWEIEAYGREFGFYKMFSKKLKQEAKEAKR